MNRLVRWIAVAAIAANLVLIVLNSVVMSENLTSLHRLHGVEAMWRAVRLTVPSAKCIGYRPND